MQNIGECITITNTLKKYISYGFRKIYTNKLNEERGGKKSSKQEEDQRYYINSQKHMERCSVPLFIREMQIRSTVRYHLASLTIIKKNVKTQKKKVLLKMWRNGTSMHCWWYCEMMQRWWKSFKKSKIKILYDLAIPLLEIYPKEFKMGSWSDTYTPMFISILFTITKR